MKDDVIQDFLDRFYEYISFNEGEEPEFDDFKKLFIDTSVVIEYVSDEYGKYIQKDINKHIIELTEVFNNYPIIKSKGFIEEEISNSIMICGPMAFVKSKYKKKYFNGTMYIEDIGTNCMQIISSEDCLKIVSIGWYEE